MSNITESDLENCLDRLADGDLAFLYTFAVNRGGRVGEALRVWGVPGDRVDAVVLDVAIAVSEHAGDWDRSSAPWPFVLGVAARVVEDDAAGVSASSSARPVGSSAERAVHLVDLENLAGGPWVGPELLLATWRLYEHVAGPRGDDHVTVAADRAVWKRVAFEVDPGVRFLAGVGPNGADDALLASVDADWVAERFDELVIGSGDGGFADLATDVRRRGVPVVVVAAPESLSPRLRRPADEVRWLPRLGDTAQRQQTSGPMLVSAA